MDTAIDATMADAAPTSQKANDYSDLLQTNYSDAFAFSEKEEQILKLYDQLRELELESGLLQAHKQGTFQVHVLPGFSLTLCSTRFGCLGAIK